MARVRGNAKQANDTLPITITDAQGNITASYTSEMVQTIKDTVAQGATDSELIMFLKVAHDYDLDPFLGQVYFAKMKGTPTIMAGRDGFRKIAKKRPDFKKCQSMAVYENDEFEMELLFGEVKNITHKFSHKDRGKVIGAYAVLTTTDNEKLVSWADIEEYDTSRNADSKYSAWIKYKSAMIKKVAETEVYKNFADISGLQAEEAMPSGFEKKRHTNLGEDDMLDVQGEEVEPKCFTDLLGYEGEEKEYVEKSKAALENEIKQNENALKEDDAKVVFDDGKTSSS
jgi:phage recombination protein Bet